MRRRTIAIAAAIAAGALAPPARAGGVAVEAPGGPDDLVGRDVVLEREGGEAAAALELNLSRKVGEPSSVAPDLWFGATDRLTIGLVHSARAMGVIDAGDGLCFRGTAHGCPEAYDNIGVDVRYRLRRGWLAVAARARLIAGSFDPWKPSVRAGALVRLHRGRFGIVADPQLQLGLANRDQGNRDWLRVPLWLAVQPARRVAIALRTGLDGEFATFTETYAIPIGVDLAVRVSERVELGAFVGFPSLGGPQNQFRRVGWLSIAGRWR